MAVIALVIPYEVFGRYVLGEMPAWSGEAATYSLVWVTMLGSAAGFRRGFQIGIRFFVEKLPTRIAVLIGDVGTLLFIAFLGAMFYFSLAQAGINWKQTSPALGIPMALPYAALPLGFGLMGMFAMEELLSRKA